MSNNNPTVASSSSQEFITVPIGNEKDDSTATAAATTTNIHNNNKEKTSNRMMRTTKNAWRRAIGCCKKSSPRTKIHLKEHQIANRKKAFGMEYMDLLQSNETTKEQLEQVIQACISDIDALVKEIADLEHQIDQVSQETNSKLKPKPLTGPNKKPIYPESGLYMGDPSLDDDNDDDDQASTKTPPDAAFSITSAEEDSNPDQESWMPSPPPPPTA
jgi:TolA-binding protein